MAVTDGFSVRTFDDPPSVVVAGEVDLATADELRSAVDKIMVRGEGRPVIIDMAGVTFIDSTGLSVLARLAIDGVAVVLRDPSVVVCSILDLTGMADLFPIEEP